MAVTVDSVGPAGGGGAHGASPAWQHVIAADATMLVVGAATGSDGGTITVTAGTTTMTTDAASTLWKRHTNDQTSGFGQLFVLPAPPTGTVTITASGASCAGSVSFKGTPANSTAYGTPVSAVGYSTTESVTVPGTDAASLIVAVSSSGSDETGAAVAPAVLRWASTPDGSSAADNSAGLTTAGGGDVTIAHTIASDWWAMMAVEIKAAGAVTKTVNPAPAVAAAAAPTASATTPNATVSNPQAPHATAGFPAPVMGATRVITSISADGTYFTDQFGDPRPFFGDDCWQVVICAGRWNGGDWQAEITTYLDQRAAQGYTAVLVLAFSYDGVWPPPYTDMRMWDGTWPFTSTNDPTSGMNETYWTRFDYFIDQAAIRGICVTFNITTPNAVSPRAAWGNNTTLWGAYGTLLGNRYKNRPNLLWNSGDDYFGDLDAGFTAMFAAITAAGDHHPKTLMGYQETTSRTDIYTGTPYTPGSWSDYDWVYTYNVPYPGIELACSETPRVPAIYADGQNYLSNGWEGDGFCRKLLWRALASGACGANTGDYAISGWDSAASPGYVTNWFYATVMTAITGYFTNLKGWHKLRPDTTSALVTSGRGTKLPPIASGGGGTYYSGDTDDYVCAAYAADGSLALIFGPHAYAITINETLMTAGYTATWVDPANAATYPATPGPAYNSAVLGTNSDGGADWVLVLRGNPVLTTSPAYGTTVTALGDGQGTWTNPGNAQGTPDATYATWAVP